AQLNIKYYDYNKVINHDQSLEMITIPSKEIRVIDGDTIQHVKTKKYYRLYMIDTPESCLLKIKVNDIRKIDNTCSNKKKEEVGGKKASLVLYKIINDYQSITIRYNPQIKDKYDRNLAWIFVDDYLVQSIIASNTKLEGYYTEKGVFTTNYKDIKLFPEYVEATNEANK
ncbi:MAG: thermonuclease family protein, partial [Bacilli bacterium]